MPDGGCNKNAGPNTTLQPQMEGGMQEQRPGGITAASQSPVGPGGCQEKTGHCLFKSSLRPAMGSVVINYCDYDYSSRAPGKDMQGEKGRRQAWGGQPQERSEEVARGTDGGLGRREKE